MKTRRAEYPTTEDASLRKDGRRKASEVLKRSLKSLAGDQQLGTFLNHVLEVLTEQLGGLASSLLLLDGAKRHLSLHSICEGGRAATAEQSRHPFAQRPHRIPKDSPTWTAIQEKHPFVQYDPASDAGFSAGPAASLSACRSVRKDEAILETAWKSYPDSPR